MDLFPWRGAVLASLQSLPWPYFFLTIYLLTECELLNLLLKVVPFPKLIFLLQLLDFIQKLVQFFLDKFFFFIVPILFLMFYFQFLPFLLLIFQYQMLPFFLQLHILFLQLPIFLQIFLQLFFQINYLCFFNICSHCSSPGLQSFNQLRSNQSPNIHSFISELLASLMNAYDWQLTIFINFNDRWPAKARPGAYFMEYFPLLSL